MKHTCGHQIQWQHIAPLRVSVDFSTNRVICEMACSFIPCYNCIAEAYVNGTAEELDLFGMKVMKGNTPRQRAYGHFIRHILTYAGVVKDTGQSAKLWIDIWNLLPDQKKKDAKYIIDAVKEQYNTERRADRVRGILREENSKRSCDEERQIEAKNRFFRGEYLEEDDQQ